MSESRPKGSGKRVLVLANNDMGLYKFRAGLLRALAARGDEVYISLPDGDFVAELKKLGCRFIDTEFDRRGTDPARDMKLYRFYRALLRKLRPDLVITYTIKPNIYGGLACGRAGVPYAANVTGLGSAIEGGGPLRTLVLAMYRAGLKKAGAVFFENSRDRELMVSARAAFPERTAVMPGAGIDLDENQPLPYPEDGPTRFLFIGRIMREKGVDELFDAAKRIKLKYGAAAVFDLVGFYEESYREKVDELTENGYISFAGYQPKVGGFYDRASCVVLPSYHEGMSNVLLEAAAAARPIITCDIPGCREAVEDGVSGMLCKSKDADSLFGALDRFMLMDGPSRREMGAAGRRLAEKTFDREDVVKRTVSLLEKLEKR